MLALSPPAAMEPCENELCRAGSPFGQCGLNLGVTHVGGEPLLAASMSRFVVSIVVDCHFLFILVFF